jgi:membrane protein YdbS with pleckstrin-like domain
MVTVKLILIMAVALAGLLGYLAVFIFQQWWIIYAMLALTAIIMVITVIITGGRVEEDEPAA